MFRDVRQYPHRAKEYGYTYPDNPYLTESVMYAKLNVSIFCNPKFVFRNNPAGLIVELVGGKLTKTQQKTVDSFLRQQAEIKLQLTHEIIPFYNRCLDVIANSGAYGPAEDLIELGAVPLLENDIAGLEERLFLVDLHLISLDAYGDFGVEFEWNLDPEHTITARYKNWDLVEVNFTSDIDW